jgi:hypothetical protein
MDPHFLAQSSCNRVGGDFMHLFGFPLFLISHCLFFLFVFLNSFNCTNMYVTIYTHIGWDPPQAVQWSGRYPNRFILRKKSRQLRVVCGRDAHSVVCSRSPPSLQVRRETSGRPDGSCRTLISRSWACTVSMGSISQFPTSVDSALC